MKGEHLNSDKEISEAMADPDKHWVIEFYGPGCHFCKQFAPSWNQFADDLETQDNNITLGSINGKKHGSRKLLTAVGVTGFPTILYFRPGT